MIRSAWGFPDILLSIYLAFWRNITNNNLEYEEWHTKVKLNTEESSMKAKFLSSRVLSVVMWIVYLCVEHFVLGKSFLFMHILHENVL